MNLLARLTYAWLLRFENIPVSFFSNFSYLTGGTLVN